MSPKELRDLADYLEGNAQAAFEIAKHTKPPVDENARKVGARNWQWAERLRELASKLEVAPV